MLSASVPVTGMRRTHTVNFVCCSIGQLFDSYSKLGQVPNTGILGITAAGLLQAGSAITS